jgi:hypothetical protein
MHTNFRLLLPALVCSVFFAQGAQGAVTATDGKALKEQQKRQAQSEALLKAGDIHKPLLPHTTGARTLIDSGGLKYFINTNITFNTTSSGSGAASEASYTHAVQADTLNGGFAAATLNDQFDGFGALCLSLNHSISNCATGNANFVFYNKLGAATLDATCSNRQVVFPIMSGGSLPAGLQVQRKVFVPSNDTFLRWLNSFTNTSGASISVTAVIANNLGSDSATKITASSSGALSPLGNANLGTTWVASFQNFSGTTSPDVRTGTVLQQAGAPVQLTGLNFVDLDDNPFWGYTFTVPAGQTVTIANFTTGQPTRALAASKAAELAGASNANQWNCMTANDKANVKNFLAAPVVVAEAIPVPTLRGVGLAAFFLMLAGLGVYFSRRRGR